MAVAIHTEGSQAPAVINTEHTLATITDTGTYVLAVDLANMVNGDVLELRIKSKLTSGDTLQLAYDAFYSHVQTRPNVYSIPVPSPIEFVATLKQVAGTGRNFIWVVYVL